MTQYTLFSLLEQAARRDGDAVALIQGGRTISYSQFYDCVLKLGYYLSESIDRKGAIAISAPDGQTVLASFFGCAAIGRPAMPLDPGLPNSMIEDLLTKHEFAALIAENTQLRSVAAPPVIMPRSGRDSPAPPLEFSMDGNAEFYWGLTSGTTGRPKIFARSHASWIASFEAAESVFSFPPGSRIMIPGPLYHSLFLYGAIHALCRGHTVILPDGQFRPNRLAKYVAGTTHLYAVPFMLNEMLKARIKAPDLRMIFSGGAKLSAELRAAIETFWPAVDLAEFYGASETSFVSFCSTKHLANAGSVGRAFPTVAVEIRDMSGAIVGSGADGEIFVSSPMLFSRYVGEKRAGPWCSAGDMGFVDDDGCLHLTGRTSRVINSKGLKIHAEAIEDVLIARPEIHRAAVVGLPDAVRDHVAVAVIEFVSGQMLARPALSAHCREALGAKFCPRRFFAADRLPLTPSGKIAVAELREALLSGQSAFSELL